MCLWIGKFIQADADVRSFVEHVALAIQGLLCKLAGQITVERLATTLLRTGKTQMRIGITT